MSANKPPSYSNRYNNRAWATMQLLNTREHPSNEQQSSINSNETVANLAKPSPDGEKLPKHIVAMWVNPETSHGHHNPHEDSNPQEDGETSKVSNQVKNDNYSLDQQRKNSFLVFIIVTIVAFLILLLLLCAFSGFATFSSLAERSNTNQTEHLGQVSETVCDQYRNSEFNMSSSTKEVLRTMKYECQEQQPSGTSEHTSAETNPYALVKDTCWVHFYDPDTGKEKKGGLQLAFGYLYFSMCGVGYLPWNFFESIAWYFAKDIEKKYVEPLKAKVEETIKTLYTLVVTRSRANFTYQVILFSNQPWCFQLGFAIVFVAPIIITKWLCWDRRHFSSRYKICPWVCDLLLLFLGCWCLGSACYESIGNASMEALKQRIEAETNQVGNMIDLNLLNKLRINGTLTKEAFRSASVRKDAESSELLDTAFARFAGSDDAFILSKEQVGNFTQYVEVVKRQDQWSPVSTWNWLISEDFRGGVWKFVNESMQWVVKQAAFFFWGCLLTKTLAGAFQIFNKFAQGTQNPNLQGFTEATQLLSNSVSGSTQTTLDVALKVAAQLDSVLKIVVGFAVIVFTALTLYMAASTVYEIITSFLRDVILATPKWWCVYYYIDGFVFALCKQYCHCTLLHQNAEVTRTIAKVDKGIEIIDKNIADTDQGASDEALRVRAEMFAFLQLCVERHLLKMPEQPILHKYFLSFVFETLVMLDTNKSVFGPVNNVASWRHKSEIRDKAFKRCGILAEEKLQTLEQLFNDIQFDVDYKVCIETTGPTKVNKSKPICLAHLTLKDLPLITKLEDVDAKVDQALKESGAVKPHWGCQDYLKALLAMFHELKRINGNEDVNNNYLWTNFGQYWMIRVEELQNIIYNVNERSLP